MNGSQAQQLGNERRPAPSVLIVEDENIFAMDLQLTLRELGYDAWAIASNAEEALARARERTPDLVLMDIRIRGSRDGVATAEAMLRERDVPIVFLTAHADDGTVERVSKTGPFGYLLKPASAAELRSCIEVALMRHSLEKKLRTRERWFSTTLKSIADAVLAVDPQGKVTFMNPAAEALTGVPLADAVGRPANEVLALENLPPELSEPPLAIALKEMRSVKLVDASLTNASTGARRLISDSAAPVVDAQETLGAVMIFQDVTDRRALERKLELNGRLASLGTMAAGVAHEVNNPLAVVVSNAEFLLAEYARQRSPGATRAGLDEVALSLSDLQSAAQRIRAIITDLRTFSRPPDPKDASVDVSRAIQWAVRSTALHTREHALVTTRLATLPPVVGDETRLGQVLVNLIINSAQAIAPGAASKHRIELSTHLDGGRVRIDVSDTGSGISPEHLKHIFDPFFTTKPIGVGTGLGLSISHGIVESLGGEISVKSELGKGTTVSVWLPVHSK